MVQNFRKSSLFFFIFAALYQSIEVKEHRIL